MSAPASAPQATGWRDRLRAWPQYVLPHHLLSRMVLGLTRLRGGIFTRLAIRRFIRRFGVDMQEAASSDPASYPNFNAFFTRPLRDGARPLAPGDHIISSPADGTISAIGPIEAGQLIQAKDRWYTVSQLLGGDAAAARFESGAFCTIYLSPRDYHRVHMPVSGRLSRMLHIPGRLFSVSPATTRALPRLFARNERVACLFNSERGAAAVVMVGAMLVGGIDTAWAGTVTPPTARYPQRRDYPDGRPGVILTRGQEMGRFNMGSTVILLLPSQRVQWQPGLQSGSRIRMGETLGAWPGGDQD